MPALSGAVTERPRAPLAVKVIAFIALIFLLESARPVVLPVAIAIILTFLLAPLVRALRSRGVNDALGAAIVVFGFLFILGLLGSRLVAPASEWIARVRRTAAAGRHDHVHHLRRDRCACAGLRRHQRDREQLIAPWIVGRRLEMSPLFVFLAVMISAWMWGIAGAFLAVPLLVIIRSAARRSKNLRLWCVYLDRGRPELPTMRTLLGIGLRRRRRRPAGVAQEPEEQTRPRSRARDRKPFLGKV